MFAHFSDCIPFDQEDPHNITSIICSHYYFFSMNCIWLEFPLPMLVWFLVESTVLIYIYMCYQFAFFVNAFLATKILIILFVFLFLSYPDFTSILQTSQYTNQCVLKQWERIDTKNDYKPCLQNKDLNDYLPEVESNRTNREFCWESV